jgi:hypothetical protein
MQTYYVRYGGQKPRPFIGVNIDGLFPSGIICRNSESSTAAEKNWRTENDHFSGLNYGVQIPNQTPRLTNQPDFAASTVRISDIDVPVASVLNLVLKWVFASLLVGVCLPPTLFYAWLALMAFVAVVFRLAFSDFHFR